MFKIFKGQWRGTPAPEPEQTIFVQVGADFRNKLHHFKGAKLSVFMAIALHMDEDGLAFPSYETLEKETGYGQDTISNALTALCDTCIDGKPVLIRWRLRDDKGHFDGSNRYRLFPTESEIVQTGKTQVWENATSGKNQAEEEPQDSKKNHTSKKNKEGADAPRVDTSTGEVLPSRNEKPAAVIVFKEVMHLWPHKSLYDVIVKTVGEDGLQLQRWRDVLMQWLAKGYSPKNVEGVLEVFRAGWKKHEAKPAATKTARPNYLGGKYADDIQH